MAHDSETHDEQILADPSSHTVEEVTSVFARSATEDVEGAKALEADGQTRKGITGWEPPKPKPAGPPTFSRERLLGGDGPMIAGQPPYVIAGALHEVDGDEFTRDQIEQHVDDFLNHPVQQEG